MVMNKLTITKADKGKTLRIHKKNTNRINTVMHNNQFTTINNPNQYYQKIIKQTLKQCNNTIQRENIWKCMNCFHQLFEIFFNNILH